MVLISAIANIGRNPGRGHSVPLRGLWFLSIMHEYDDAIEFGAFRPLAGIMVLISRIFTEPFDALMNIFRPLAGIMVLISKA